MSPTHLPSPAASEAVPALVTLHLWGVSRRQVPAALLQMAIGPGRVRRRQGALFAKLLGTATSTSFGLRDTDLRHWALLTAWDHIGLSTDFEQSTTARAWSRISEESLVVRMHPLSSRGTWSGRAPFGDPETRPTDGPVASITRARIRPAQLRRFSRAVPAVARDLDARTAAGTGALLALGVGELPVGLQGTFSLWPDAAALREFAHRGAAHAQAITDTTRLDWYAEELFARFAVESVEGSYRGKRLLLPDAAP